EDRRVAPRGTCTGSVRSARAPTSPARSRPPPMTTESNRPPCTRAVSRGSDEEVRAEVGSVPGTPASSTAPPCPARASSSRRVKRRNSAPPREGRVAQHGGARVGAIDDLVPHDGLGELLQRERPDLREREPLTAAEQLDDDAAAQNLP